jgi:hypothetical protein
LFRSNIAYLNAKNAPTTNPGIVTMSVPDEPILKDRRIANPADANDIIISISITGFEVATTYSLPYNGIRFFPFKKYSNNDRCQITSEEKPVHKE